MFPDIIIVEISTNLFLPNNQKLKLNLLSSENKAVLYRFVLLEDNKSAATNALLVLGLSSQRIHIMTQQTTEGIAMPTTAAMPSSSSPIKTTTKIDIPMLPNPWCESTISPSYALGLTFILFVCIIWAASSTLVQYMYNYSSNQDEEDLVTPFLVTYIGVALFTILLPLKLCRTQFSSHNDGGSSSSLSSTTATATTNQRPIFQTTDFLNWHDFLCATDQAIFITESFDPTSLYPHLEQPPVYWTNSQHFITAAKIAPVWFFTNWCYNRALALTSIASSTTLASTTSAFAFVLEVCLGHEQFGWAKMLGVLFGISGSTLTGIHDARAEGDSEGDAWGGSRDRVVGDIVAILAAIGFATYAVQIRVLFPEHARYSMKVILGYIGVINVVVLSPIALVHILRQRNGLDLTVIAMAVIRGLFDYVLSEYLFFRAVLLTSATVTSVGLGLTIPMAFVADFIMGMQNIVSIFSMSGAACIFIGFLLVNVDASDPGMIEQERRQRMLEYQDMEDDQPPPTSMPPRRSPPPATTKHNRSSSLLATNHDDDDEDYEMKFPQSYYDTHTERQEPNQSTEHPSLRHKIPSLLDMSGSMSMT